MAEGARSRIALIDDDPALVELMRELLVELEGYEVFACGEGDRAADLVRRERPDVVVLDVHVGGDLDGWAVLEQLRRDPATRSIPVIVCSGAIRDPDEPRLREHAADFLPKPFDLDVLLDKVRAALTPQGR
jgi:DNA-binding response OmpR family regulator